MGKRKVMLESNRRTREFLFSEGWSILWFKTHEDMRKKSNGDYYYTNDNKPHRCLDPFNLFDACGWDGDGRFLVDSKSNPHPGLMRKN